MRLEKVETLDQLHTGDRVFCKICGTPIRDAKVFIGKGPNDGKSIDYLYICQNELAGRSCYKRNRMGYLCSWAVWLTRPGSMSLEQLCEMDSVTGLRKVVKGGADAAQ